MSVSAEVHKVIDLLSTREEFVGENVFVYPASPEYGEETMIRGVHRDLYPEVVIRPTKLAQVAPLSRSLYESKLDFAIRNGGAGSASARHVVVSLRNLREMTLDKIEETFVVGAGALWRDVNTYLSTEAPEWAVVGPRSSYLGVVGVTVIGGVSYLSDEFGLVSDPKNMLDVQIALGDGRLIWASEEPDLLWTMRAGRCAFGIITALKLRARKLEIDHVYCAWILYPMSKLEEVSRAVSKHLNTNHDPKLGMTAYILSPNGLYLKYDPGVGVLVFDRHGAEHAKSESGFKWAFDVDGGVAMGGEMTLHQAPSADAGHGRYAHWDATGLFEEVDDTLVVRAKEWYYSLIEEDPDLEEGSYLLLEFCGPAVFGSTRPEETAWPHGKHKHILQAGVGYKAENNHLKSISLDKLAEAFQHIPRTPLSKGDFQPTFLEPTIMDLKEMYGTHYEKLRSIADQYDPRRRFRSLFNLDPNFTWTSDGFDC